MLTVLSGVNDAPSLKKSDCGIAVEGATEAAQAAADIVFLAPWSQHHRRRHQRSPVKFSSV